MSAWSNIIFVQGKWRDWVFCVYGYLFNIYLAILNKYASQISRILFQYCKLIWPWQIKQRVYMAPRSWLILFAGVQNEMVGNAEISVQLILKSNSESFGHWSKNLVYRPFNFPFQIVDHFYAIFICLNWNKSKFST